MTDRLLIHARRIRRELNKERALADRLAEVLEHYYADDVLDQEERRMVLAAWKEARKEH